MDIKKITASRNQSYLHSFLQSKKADLALGYMGKMIIALVALLVLLYILGVIFGEFGTQGEKTVTVLNDLG